MSHRKLLYIDIRAFLPRLCCYLMVSAYCFNTEWSTTAILLVKLSKTERLGLNRAFEIFYFARNGLLKHALAGDIGIPSVDSEIGHILYCTPDA